MSLRSFEIAGGVEPTSERMAPRTQVDWNRGLPTLRGTGVTLRELRRSDASTLLPMLANKEVARFLAPPPTTQEAFERFIGWTHRQRAEGRHLCFGVMPDGELGAIGVFQIWPVAGNFVTAEMGFALGPPFWSTGVFIRSACVFLEFVFETLGVHRLEGRAAAMNGRGNGALRKLGAVPECTLRKCFAFGGDHHDHIMWSLLVEEWRVTAGRGFTRY